MTGAVGAFGKVPGMGDFLRLNLSAGFVQTWDGWLQDGLLAAREALGSRWDDQYLSAPIWRFSLPGMGPGLAPTSGVLMPSVDRVGRQFPLILAAPCAAGSSALRHFVNGAFFQQLETVALAALEEDLDRVALQSRLEGLAPILPDVGRIDAAAYAGGLPPEQVLAAQGVEEHSPGAGVWTAVMSGDHRMFLSPALPDMRQIVGMFDLSAAIWQSDAMV